MIVMRIPERLYVGIQGNTSNGTALANLTPWGEDAAAKKRMASVDEWMKSLNFGYKVLGTYVFDNTPLVGFRLTSAIRTAIHGGSDKWQVEDPRGFVCEINSTNLAELLGSSVIDRGDILDPCVWARHGSANVLLNTNSKDYQEAMENTRISKRKTSLKDVQLGNRIVLQNSIEGVYLGRVGVVERLYWDQSRDSEFQNLLQPNLCNLHALLDTTENQIHLVSSPKVSSVLDSAQLSHQECELLLNDALEKGTQLRGNTYFTRPVALFSISNSFSKPLCLGCELEETSSQPAPRSYQKVILCDYNDGFGEYVVFSNRKLIYEIDKSQLLTGLYVPTTVQVNSMSRARWAQKQTEVDVSQISAYYELYCKLQTPCGNILRIRV